MYIFSQQWDFTTITFGPFHITWNVKVGLNHIACFASSLQFGVSLRLTFTSCSILQMWPHQGGGGQICKTEDIYDQTFTHDDRHGPDLHHIFHKFTVISLINQTFFSVQESAPETLILDTHGIFSAR